MPIIWTNEKDMYNQTKECFNEFENIQDFFDIQNELCQEELKYVETEILHFVSTLSQIHLVE